jgi:peptidoglycan/xylan/chitin deacetylase (PgdA/CDA1 family)
MDFSARISGDQLRRRFVPALKRTGARALIATGLSQHMTMIGHGRGVVFCGHRIIHEEEESGFAPSRSLAVRADYLEQLLTHLRHREVELIDLSAMPERLMDPRGRPFACFTFDDGYADCIEWGLPIFERHRAPFTVFVTTGFVERTHLMWWAVLEEAIRRAETLEIPINRTVRRLDLSSVRKKSIAFRMLTERCILNSGYAETELVPTLIERFGEGLTIAARRLPADWAMLERLVSSPWGRVGAHTASHPLLTILPADRAWHEITQARTLLQRRLGIPVAHFAYPYGGRGAVGPREMKMARDAGFELALTTEERIAQASDSEQCLALPRIGFYQDLRLLDIHMTNFASLVQKFTTVARKLHPPWRSDSA